MDQEKFNALASLVREARAEDKRTLADMNATTTAWKTANAILSERIKVLNDWLTNQVNEHTAV